MKIKNILRNITIIYINICFTAGCAPMLSGVMNSSVTNETIMAKTTDYFGVSRKEIIITKIKKSALSTSYKTKYNGKNYNCTIYYGAVSCKEPGTY
jgi:hypothetical protein